MLTALVGVNQRLSQASRELGSTRGDHGASLGAIVTSGQLQGGINYDDPPLVETVLCVQFDDLIMLNAGHLGWYWHEHLAPQGWLPPVIVDAPAPSRERFADDPATLLPTLRIEFGPSPGRLQTRSADGTLMIQVQRSQFVLNWLRTTPTQLYPRFSTLLPDFDGFVRSFAAFLAHAGLPAINVNQWEVIYVNHILKGGLWKTAADFHGVFPALFSSSAEEAVGFPTVAARSTYEMTDSRGRLHVEATRKSKINQPDTQMLHLQMTARGTVKDEVGWSYLDGLQLGHQTIVTSFDKLASDEAKRTWGKR
jgi:hypothetical protein